MFTVIISILVDKSILTNFDHLNDAFLNDLIDYKKIKWKNLKIKIVKFRDQKNWMKPLALMAGMIQNNSVW